MQNVLLPGAVVLLTVVLWLRGKPAKPMLSSTDASVVAQLNRAQLELVTGPDPSTDSTASAGDTWIAPQTEKERLALQHQLRAAMNGGPEARLQAVRIASHWRHRCVLPLLRQALRDTDARVVELAAMAIEPYRGRPGPVSTQVARPPRNVSRMRYIGRSWPSG